MRCCRASRPMRPCRARPAHANTRARARRRTRSNSQVATCYSACPRAALCSGTRRSALFMNWRRSDVWRADTKAPMAPPARSRVMHSSNCITSARVNALPRSKAASQRPCLQNVAMRLQRRPSASQTPPAVHTVAGIMFECQSVACAMQSRASVPRGSPQLRLQQQKARAAPKGCTPRAPD